MIDLHTHTTASDGRCSPHELVASAHRAGVRVLAVTDHDTVAAAAASAVACESAGIDFVPGIELTAVLDGLDVHVLGYFIDTESAALNASLAAQRRRRLDRVREMIARLAALGPSLDADTVLGPALADPTTSPGRPWIARALVRTGHVTSVAEAFDRWLARGRPAFVPSVGPDPPEVFGHIHAAGGIASLAHPGLLRRDEWLPGFAANGLDALEAYHSDHDEGTTTRYLKAAEQLALAVSGGSDFHGDGIHGVAAPGSVSLPEEAFLALCARARR